MYHVIHLHVVQNKYLSITTAIYSQVHYGELVLRLSHAV